MTTVAQMKELARAEAAKHGLDPEMFVGQLAQESGNFAPDVVSGKRKSNAKKEGGAVGVAQFLPSTARDFGIDPTDPLQAIPAAAKYMAQLKKQFGSEDLARQAYNWGMGNLSKHLKDPAKHPLPKETREYNAHVAKRAGKPAPEDAIPVFAKTPPGDALRIMQDAAPPGGGLFASVPRTPPAGASPMGQPATPKPAAPEAVTALFAPSTPAAAPQSEVLGDIFARANDSAGALFPSESRFPDHFDGMIRQLLKRV